MIEWIIGIGSSVANYCCLIKLSKLLLILTNQKTTRKWESKFKSLCGGQTMTFNRGSSERFFCYGFFCRYAVDFMRACVECKWGLWIHAYNAHAPTNVDMGVMVTPGCVEEHGININDYLQQAKFIYVSNIVCKGRGHPKEMAQ